jgi:hypothetical protein
MLVARRASFVPTRAEIALKKSPDAFTDIRAFPLKSFRRNEKILYQPAQNLLLQF